ncbi:MAG TPA: hypothetical protein VLS25_11375 [Dehalococcoidia bacterium]|nr:hypothetical protein [Dehalococcoidia bacterium]
MTGGRDSTLLGRVLVAFFAMAASLAAFAILALSVFGILLPVLFPPKYDEPPPFFIRLVAAAVFAIPGVTFALVAIILWQYVLRQSDGSPPPDESR